MNSIPPPPPPLLPKIQTYLTNLALDLILCRQPTTNPTKPSKTTPFAFQPIQSTHRTSPSSPQLYYHCPQPTSNTTTTTTTAHATTAIAAIIPLPPNTALQTITNLLISSHQRPSWDIHCLDKPITISSQSTTSTYESREIHPGRLTSPIRTLDLRELPVAARRLLIHRQWHYYTSSLPASPKQSQQSEKGGQTKQTPFTPVFVLSETPGLRPLLDDLPFTTVVAPAPYTIGWVVIATAPNTYALVAFDDVHLGGWLPSSVALQLRQQMLMNRLEGFLTCCRMITAKVNRNMNTKPNPNSKTEQTTPKSKVKRLPSNDPHHYLAPLSRSVSLWAYAPQLLSLASSSYGPIERFKYAIATFVAGIHTTTKSFPKQINISPLPPTTHLNMRVSDGYTTGSSSTVNVDLEPILLPTSTDASSASNFASEPFIGARLRLHVPTPDSVEFLMTSQPSGSFEVGGTWKFDPKLKITGNEGTIFNMNGSCVISFADSSHIEINVSTKRHGNNKTEKKIHFEDPSHRLTCDIDFGGKDNEDLSGTILYDGSTVSTISGNWKTLLLFDKWDCWNHGSFQTKVKVVQDVDEMEEETGTNEYKLVKGEWIPST